jgi:hypothetical protein
MDNYPKKKKKSMDVWSTGLCIKKKSRFKYYFGSQPLAFVSNWFLTFQLSQIGPQPFNLVSKWSLPLSDRWKILTWLMVFFFFFF